MKFYAITARTIVPAERNPKSVSSDGLRVLPDARWIAKIPYGIDFDAAEALIAQANIAPDLLAALEGEAWKCPICRGMGTLPLTPGVFNTVAPECEACKPARTVIAKARGLAGKQED